MHSYIFKLKKVTKLTSDVTLLILVLAFTCIFLKQKYMSRYPLPSDELVEPKGADFKHPMCK